MSELLLAHESLVRLGAFFAVLAAMAAWELAAPRRRREIPRLVRWSNNFALVALDAVVVRLVLPTVALGAALTAQQQGWGLFGAVPAPGWLAVLATVVVLDLAMYLQHVVFHAVPALWRLHRMHHADLEFDVSTGIRFHPLEILLSMAIKLAMVAALGAPAAAVLVFEILLNATAMFNHANIRMPVWLDRVLRWIVVTPDMHRIHHSVESRETNSNFGFNLPWWDRLLGTYKPDPSQGHERMTIGIERFRSVDELRIDRMLLQPLRGPADGSPINDRR
jgi:sterol desaturase/sphingolipid hydroxylase (fatty acid hydroxylase superfamily)